MCEAAEVAEVDIWGQYGSAGNMEAMVKSSGHFKGEGVKLKGHISMRADHLFSAKFNRNVSSSCTV